MAEERRRRFHEQHGFIGNGARRIVLGYMQRIVEANRDNLAWSRYRRQHGLCSKRPDLFTFTYHPLEGITVSTIGYPILDDNQHWRITE